MPKSGILTAGSRALGYDIVTLLGQGQFGEVYEVFDTTVGRKSALKLIMVTDPAVHKAAIEAQMQYLCSHDNVVQIRTADEISAGTTGYVAIEMEFIEEGSLEDRLKTGFVGCKEAVYHIKQILFALEHAHRHGIVHRDVKPANIMLSTPRTKLSDFGTVIQPSSGKEVIDLFYVPHAPPEALNNAEFTELCDVYAAGLTLLRTVNNLQDWTGTLAALGDWRKVAKDGKMAAKIGFAPTVPRALRTIINRACSPDTSKRYPSAAAFRGALEGLKFANDWIKLSDIEWVSEKEGRKEVLKLHISSKFEVIYTVNGRRKNSQCKIFPDERAARAYIHDIIYETTLESLN